jgi:hypothetical protein
MIAHESSPMVPALSTFGRGRQLFSPLAGFLLSRYPSTAQPTAVIEVPEPPEIGPVDGVVDLESPRLDRTNGSTEQVVRSGSDLSSHEIGAQGKQEIRLSGLTEDDALEKDGMHRDAQATSPQIPVQRTVG